MHMAASETAQPVLVPACIVYRKHELQLYMGKTLQRFDNYCCIEIFLVVHTGFDMIHDTIFSNSTTSYTTGHASVI